MFRPIVPNPQRSAYNDFMAYSMANQVLPNNGAPPVFETSCTYNEMYADSIKNDGAACSHIWNVQLLYHSKLFLLNQPVLQWSELQNGLPRIIETNIGANAHANRRNIAGNNADGHTFAANKEDFYGLGVLAVAMQPVRFLFNMAELLEKAKRFIVTEQEYADSYSIRGYKVESRWLHNGATDSLPYDFAGLCDLKLFLMLYAPPRDFTQILARDGLYKRGWFFYTADRTWMRQAQSDYKRHHFTVEGVFESFHFDAWKIYIVHHSIDIRHIEQPIHFVWKNAFQVNRN